SSLPVESAEDLRQRQAWYALRWPTAEEFHQVEKTGCGEEQLRFETAEAMKPMLGLLSVVAVRILQLRDAERRDPGAPASRVASAAERELVAAATPGGPPAAGLTVRGVGRGVARLGGFVGGRGDGARGWKALWRGYQRLQDMAEGAQRLRAATQQAPPTPAPDGLAHERQKYW